MLLFDTQSVTTGQYKLFLEGSSDGMIGPLAVMKPEDGKRLTCDASERAGKRFFPEQLPSMMVRPTSEQPLWNRLVGCFRILVRNREKFGPDIGFRLGRLG